MTEMELRKWAVEQAVQIGQPFTVHDVLNGARRIVNWVECRTCEAEGPTCDSKAEAVAKWNEHKGSDDAGND
jgi:hypothetical protein